MKITNNTRETLSFVLRGKARDGVPPTGSVEPGQAADLDVDPGSATFKGRVLSGAISVPKAAAEKASQARAG